MGYSKVSHLTGDRLETIYFAGGKGMLTIGQMSKACGVTVKTLHYYDKIGLLTAQEVDPDTGYRYYCDDQIGRMLLIDRLKRYGFSLAEIQELLQISCEEELHRQLKGQRLRLLRERERLSITIHEIDSHLAEFERTGDLMSYQNQYEVKLKESERMALISVRETMPVSAFGDYYARLFQRVIAEKITSLGVTMAIYHDETFDPACNDTELAVVIAEEDQADRVLPAMLCAATVHKGPYAALPDAYGRVYSWLKASGYSLAGPPFEIYRKTAFDKLPPEEWETEIFFPVKK